MTEHPFYRFFRRFTLPVPFKKWQRLPRFPSYKNEYWDKKARYTPRPRTGDVYLNLGAWSGPTRLPDAIESRDRVGVRRLRDEDWADLPAAFYGAFANQLPLSLWNKHAARRAARCILEWTRTGRDGPLARDACFTAWTAKGKERDGPLTSLCGAAIVTLIPACRMRGLPEGAAIAHPEDRSTHVVPHLDWVFVNFWLQRHGVGSLLLDHVVHALRARGVRYLASTFQTDNASSVQWHWRNGFQLPPSGWSYSQVRVERLDTGPISEPS